MYIIALIYSLENLWRCHCCLNHSPQLKTQMWQLLKGHDHLQDEFSIFFDHLRPAASRMGDFEEINWTEEKEYEVQALSCSRVFRGRPLMGGISLESVFTGTNSSLV